MYKGVKKNKLGKKKSHRESMINNLLRSLFDNSYIVTTTPKAKVLKSEASSLIESGKKYKEDLSFRRKLQVILGDSEVVNKYKEYISREKTGVSYIRVGYRKGDNAELSRVYLLGMDKKKKKVVRKKKDEDKEEKKEESRSVDSKVLEQTDTKKIDKTIVVKDTRRATSRSGV
ncbi:MAG: L17 family ribosomal protein [Candidatus Dojkabacteria bacterium]